MTPDQFCYWLQGLLELQPDLKTLNAAQVQTIREHLGYVFESGHLTPAAPRRLPMPAIPELGQPDDEVAEILERERRREKAWPWPPWPPFRPRRADPDTMVC
jgi:hypothetical protein